MVYNVAFLIGISVCFKIQFCILLYCCYFVSYIALGAFFLEKRPINKKIMLMYIHDYYAKRLQVFMEIACVLILICSTYLLPIIIFHVFL